MRAGVIVEWWGTTVPDEFYECDGSLKDNTDDEALLDVFLENPATWGRSTAIGNAVTGGSQPEWTLFSHGLSDGDIVYLTNWDGGATFADDTKYYVQNVTTDTFELTDTPGGASLVEGLDNRSADVHTQFKIPDLRQRFVLGLASSGTGTVLGETGGVIDHDHDTSPTGSLTVVQSGSGESVASSSHTHIASSENPPYMALKKIMTRFGSR